MSSATRRTLRLRLPALTLALVVLLAACAPLSAPGEGAGPPSGQAPMGDAPMHGGSMGDMHRQSGDERRDEEAPPAVDGAPDAQISATEMAFTPDELTLQAGEPLNVTVVNDGDVFHDFDLPAADVHLNLEPGEQATVAITIDEPGAYQATCTVPGHAGAGMTLSIDVR